MATPTPPFSPPYVPDTTFIFKPDYYQIFNGRVKFDLDHKAKNIGCLGYFLLALSLIPILGIFFNNPFDFLHLIVLILFSGLFATGVYLVWTKWKADFYQKFGKVAVGQLISIEGETKAYTDQKNREVLYFQITAQYSFYGPGHRTKIVGTTICKREDLKNQPLPALGTPVVILFFNPQNYLVC